MTPLPGLRRVWLTVHLWLGVGLLVALIPLSVTGSVLVWHDQIDRVLYAQRYAVTGPTVAQPVEAYAEAAQRAFGVRAVLTQVRLPQKAGDPVVAVGRMAGEPGPGGRPRTLNVWIDPPTIRVLDTAEVAKGFSMVLHRIHGTLLIPEVGRKVVGWLGWTMFVSSATGLWLWWPRRGGFLSGLHWRRGTSNLFNLHHVVGFWICVPLAVLSLTGVYISFPETSRAIFGLPQPPPRPPPAVRFAPPLMAPNLSLTKAVSVALTASPGASVVEISVPTQGKTPVWRVGVKAPDAEATRTIQVIDASGDLRTDGPGPGAGPPTDNLSPLMRRIHDGHDMGLIWQIVIFLGGLAPAILGLSGAILWARRQFVRKGV